MNVFDILFLLLYVGSVVAILAFIVLGLLASFRKEEKRQEDSPIPPPRNA